MGEQILRRPKKLIVCCDGTWMDSDNGLNNEGTWFHPSWELQTPSNVTRIGRAILAEDSQHHPQVVYYQAGVGTGFSWTEQIVGGGTGEGLAENIREAYSFLANNYSEGDSIFLIGFSRGAFTARSISGLIGGVGLLEKHALPVFYDVFKDWEHTGAKDYHIRVKKDYPRFSIKASADDPQEYLKQYKDELKKHGLTREVEITAVGVWDTVGALGIPTPEILQKIGFPAFLHEYRFFDTDIDNHILHAFQALALDEKRSSYSPAIWERPTGCNTKLKQVWFPGVHSNIGGSYADSGLADITLAWMMSQLEPWLEFDEQYLVEQWTLNSEYHQEERHKSLYHPHRIHPEHTPLLHSRHNTLQVTSGDIVAAPKGDKYSNDNDMSLFPDASSSDEEANVHLAESVGPTAPSSHPGWALTKIYNSNKFPTSLGGTTPRTPGRYTKTDYYSNKRLTEPMRETGEHVHASVRVRKDALDKKYDPAGMRGWVWEEDAVTRGRWVYRGEDVKWQGKKLPEDELGRLEIKLLKLDQRMRARVASEELRMMKRATLAKVEGGKKSRKKEGGRTKTF
ncbi:uncharacterized protein K452DRAFT_301472 [Aplosporella prunicola CBS 121167]|uniref:T6SS Phospholipase effector Tle1-like catalytic domain-containing protein n=1 Tax=Aplosporella prunicola CBS 121167 TaxID=1176127 RepID=A0A6A6B402_9PEZI|nr:uncharacterized protein K452DRAFT_301472 [Aplosporella prunicola CBS 121167]KAF2138103.1 hypothetical protein K452DRAFT_301472 [Aplosporella prunicola CBS 121167]